MSYPERDVQIVTALNQTWDRLNTVSGNRLPDADWYLTAGPDSPHSVAWDTTPVVLRINLQVRSATGGSLMNRPADEILAHVVHLAAHAITRHDAAQGAEGRYHGTNFAEAAEVLGLDVVQPGTADFNTGTGRIPAQEQPKLASKYAAYLRRIDKAMETWEPERARLSSRSPQTMRCQCTVDTILAGMAKRGVRVTSTPNAPKVINASSGVRERGGIVCADCGQTFA